MTITKEHSTQDLKKLRMDGYYLSISKGEIHTFKAFVLYQNGVMQFANGYTYPEIKDYFIINQMDAEPNKRLHWGVYDIQDEVMKVQYWGLPSGGGYPVAKLEGRLLTHTSFYVKSKRTGQVDTFYFREYLPKPDSTNQFIE